MDEDLPYFSWRHYILLTIKDGRERQGIQATILSFTWKNMHVKRVFKAHFLLTKSAHITPHSAVSSTQKDIPINHYKE